MTDSKPYGLQNVTLSNEYPYIKQENPGTVNYIETICGCICYTCTHTSDCCNGIYCREETTQN